MVRAGNGSWALGKQRANACNDDPAAVSCLYPPPARRSQFLYTDCRFGVWADGVWPDSILYSHGHCPGHQDVCVVCVYFKGLGSHFHMIGQFTIFFIWSPRLLSKLMTQLTAKRAFVSCQPERLSTSKDGRWQLAYMLAGVSRNADSQGLKMRRI